MALKGGKLMNMVLHKIAVRMGRAGHVQVGFLEGSTYPDGTPTAMVAAIQEYGAPAANIPPRPYFRNMISAKSPQWGEQLGRVTVAADYDAEVALGRMGMGIAGQLQESIRSLTDPPLAPATVQAKGFDKPLIDTGHLLQSVDYEVKS